MKKTTVEGVMLTLINQDSTESENMVCKRGMIEQTDKKRFVFSEEIPRKRTQPNPRIYDGNYLSMTCNKKGQYLVYVKGEVPKKREQRKDWSIGVYGDLSAAIEHMSE